MKEQAGLLVRQTIEISLRAFRFLRKKLF